MPSGSKLFFLTREISLNKTCCWRADHEILIHNDESQSELIFVSARQHVLISDTSSLKKTYSDSNIINNQNRTYCNVFKWTLLRRTSQKVTCLDPTSSRCNMCTPNVSNVINHKFSHGVASLALNGENVNVML